MFRITNGKGFHITFANGYTLSVQFGPGDYCNNRNAACNPGEHFTQARDRCGRDGCADAEVAVFDPNDHFVQLGKYNKVIGGVSPARVAEIIATIITDPQSLAFRADDAS